MRLLIYTHNDDLNQQNNHLGHNIQLLLNERCGMNEGQQQGAWQEAYCWVNQWSLGTVPSTGTCLRGAEGWESWSFLQGDVCDVDNHMLESF